MNPTDARMLGDLEKAGVLRLFRGKVISKKDAESNPGPYPVYSSSVANAGLFLTYGDYMFDEELISWSVDGGGHFFYRPKHKFSVTNVSGYIRVLDRRLDVRFLAYQLQALHAKQVFDYTLKAHPSVIRKAYSLWIPDIDVQRSIASVLADVDALIASLERLVGKKRAIKQGMMQELLTGRTRLNEYDDEWSAASLGKLGMTVRGVSYNPLTDLRNHSTHETADLLRANNVQDSLLDLRDLLHVHRNRVRSNQFLQSGDVLICAANGSRQLVGKAAAIGQVEPRTRTFGAFMMVYRPHSRTVLPAYAALHFQTKLFRDWVEVLLAGSSINNLRPSDVAAFVIPLPPRAEQERIAELISDADTEIDALERRLKATRAIKTGMMQELLTGRTRLPADGVST